VTGLTLAAFMQLSLLSTDAETYAQAHKEMTETGKPMVVMVGTDWCGPCRKMKQVVLPEVRKRGLLQQVAFALVNADNDRNLATKLIGKGPIPQLIMFRQTPDGWRRRKLVGGQEVEKVENFLREGIAQDEAEKTSEAPGAPAEEDADGVEAVPVSGS
jgi:thioredoxin-like negative regulator of GroEL